MSARLLAATRKGLFIVDRSPNGWRVSRVALLGDNVSMALPDPRDGAIYAALDHGHFGPKMQRSEDAGTTWTEITAPAMPPRPPDEAPWIDSMGRTIPETVQRI